MDIVNVVEATVAVVAVLGSVGTLIFQAGSFKKSIEAGTEIMKLAISDNTQSTRDLATVLDKHMVKTDEVTVEFRDLFHKHDIRITTLELREK